MACAGAASARREIELRRLLLLAVVAALWVGPVRAQASAREEQLVLWPFVSDGLEYRRVAYPRQADTIRVLADTPIIFDARRTQVYLWPLTREYLADFTTLNEPISGTLEIVSAGGEVRRIVPRRYSLWYPDGVAAGRAELLLDEIAQQVYDTYVREARAAVEAARAFELRRAEHQARAQDWLRQAAARVNPLPPPPPEFTEREPAPYRPYASEIEEAPVVSLPPGEYRVRWRGPDGTVIPESERRVISFAPRRRAIGYRILPESRWTQSETSFDPDETLYLNGDAALFLQPVVVEEYNASLYARLHRPQTLEAPDSALHVWVPRGTVSGAQVAVWRGTEQLGTIPELPYRVAQQSGSGFGYSIELFEQRGSSLEPDFVAMRLPPDLGRVSRISLLGPDGAELPGSRREVRTVRTTLDPLIYAPASLPLLLAVAMRLRRPGRHRDGQPLRTSA